MPHKDFRKGFTLIELLVVIAIIAVLAIVVVLVLNPAALLQQSRDSNRMSDMNTLTSALNLYNEDQGGNTGYSLGTPGVIYVSVPDPTATTTAGTNCSGLGFSSTGYHCPASSTYRKVNGTGWIPINLASSSTGSTLSALPVDPVNTTSSGQYYEYMTNGATFEVESEPESRKYIPVGGVSSFAGGSSESLLGAFAVTFATSTYAVGGYPSAIAFDPHTNTMWVANYGSNTVTQISDTNFASSTYAMGAGSGPGAIAFDSNTNIWVANSTYGGSNSVTKINDTSYATASYNGGQYPSLMIFDPHTNTIWTGLEVPTVVLINATSYVTSTFALPVSTTFPENFAFDSHTNTIWVTNYANSVTQINDTTFASSTYVLGAYDDGVAFDPHTNTIWVANGTGITQINDTSYASTTYPIGSNSANVAFDPHTDSIWVTNEVNSTITQINDITYATTTYSVGSNPDAIAFDSHNNSIWVTIEGGSKVMVFTPNR